MSYILDALRKADAERERDPARGIHAQPAALPADAPRRAPLWIALAGALVLAGAASAWLLRPAPVPPATRAVIAPVTAPVEAPPAAAPVVVPVAAAVTPPPPPALPAPVAERVSAKLPVAPVMGVKAAALVAAPGAAPAVAPAPTPAVAAAPAALAPAAPASDRVLAVAELPQEVQRELPKLQITGGVHSDNPAQRLLIVGGQVMNEGAEVAPGVVLEQIRARTAVLKFRGYRYSVGY